MKRVCELCRRSFGGPGGEASPETLTADSPEGIMLEDASAGLFARLCPQCGREAFEEETLTPPAYPYRH